ncbi:MAG: hypothetical protein J1F37_05170 [Oscillospiraceae bacterium]|nr:hypothetical protein [Oscillospiraceae bacterium]
MFKTYDSQKLCAVCQYWDGNANVEFVFGHKIQFDNLARGYCRERQVQTPAMQVCPKFQRRPGY